HGEAVAAGMVMAADLSWRRGGISQAELDRTVALLQQARLPVKAPADMTDETFLSLMGRFRLSYRQEPSPVAWLAATVKAPADMTDETFLSLMGVDKKVLDGRLR